MIVVGVDPGAKETGIVLVDGRHLLDGCTVKRDRGDSLPDSGYLAEVVDVVGEYVGLGASLVRVESLVAPNPHLGLTAVTPLLGAAMVLGAVMFAFPDAVLVRPAKNGSRLMSSYPMPLRPLRGRGAGSDRLRHMRSAFDVACTQKGV